MPNTSNLPEINLTYIVNNLNSVFKARKKYLYLIMQVELEKNDKLPMADEYKNINEYKLVGSTSRVDNLLFVLQPIDMLTKKSDKASFTIIGNKNTLEDLEYQKFNDNMFYIKTKEVSVLKLTEYVYLPSDISGESVTGNVNDYLIIHDSDHFEILNDKAFASVFEVD